MKQQEIFISILFGETENGIVKNIDYEFKLFFVHRLR